MHRRGAETDTIQGCRGWLDAVAAHSAPASALAQVSTASTALNFTGERFTPEVRGPIWYEHWHRYAFVAELVRGKRVLDAACGEGYGSYLLAHAAAQVTGVDISGDAVAHARERYSLDNLTFTQGSVSQLPLPDASVDVVVSFETIEHLPAQREMLAEFRRVLTDAGLLVISSPNRPVYNEAGEVENHFHVAELDRTELKALLDPAFPQQQWFGQRIVAQSLLWAEGDCRQPAQFLVLPQNEAKVVREPAPPMYFVVICASPEAHLPPCPALSMFDDGALALWRDYARALERERQLAWDEIDARAIAESRLAELIAAVNALASEKDAGAEKDRRIVALTAAQAAFEQEVMAHAATRAQLAYRETPRGWLRLPFSLLKRRWVVSR
jgi:SAM-dependent methyltransferase